MSLTFTEKYNENDLNVRTAGSKLKTGIWQLTFDSSYPTGGEACDFTSVSVTTAFTTVYSVMVQGEGDTAAGYVFQYDYTNAKLLVFVEEAAAAGGPLLELANATDIATLKVRAVVMGV